MKSPDNDLKKVVGLRYKKDEGLPRVILKGAGHFAEDIIDKGHNLKKGPLIIQNELLAKQLYKMSIDTEIRPELFELVATVLTHLYTIEETYKGT
ncbi:hypothetical protein IMCC1989_1995 [gamma proteobacterium IMCC1989]|nr:hypothetical protein IMCC1989_1995 [gamma proteobacterium IMCC1989]